MYQACEVACPQQRAEVGDNPLTSCVSYQALKDWTRSQKMFFQLVCANL